MVVVNGEVMTTVGAGSGLSVVVEIDTEVRIVVSVDRLVVASVLVTIVVLFPAVADPEVVP